MKLRILLLLVLACTPVFGEPSPKKPPDVMELDQVIAQVQEALNEYQNNLGTGDYKLPPLSSAEFDFKTTAATTGTGAVSLLIFKFGTSHEKDFTNDITYTYAPPPPTPTTTKFAQSLGSRPPPSLKDQLAQTIQSAAKVMKESTATVGGLPLSRLTVTLQYGVKWDVNAAGTFQISFITVGLGGDRNKNTVQSVKLVFGK